MSEHSDVVQTASYARFLRFLKPVHALARPAAYGSEIGEVVRGHRPGWVKALYGVTFGYIALDVGIKVHEAHEDEKLRIAGETLAWHSMASIVMPTIAVSGTIKASQHVINKLANAPMGVKRYAAPILGLATIPFIIHPIDHAADWMLEKGKEMFKDKF